MFNLKDLHHITSLLSPSGLYEQFKKLLHDYEEKSQEVEDLKKTIIELKNKLREEIGEQKIPSFAGSNKGNGDKKNGKQRDPHHPKPKKKVGAKKD